MRICKIGIRNDIFRFSILEKDCEKGNAALIIFITVYISTQ